MVKNLPADAGDAGSACSIPESERTPGEGNGTPLQYSCLKKKISMDRGAWQVHGVSKNLTQLRD